MYIYFSKLFVEFTGLPPAPVAPLYTPNLVWAIEDKDICTEISISHSSLQSIQDNIKRITFTIDNGNNHFTIILAEITSGMKTTINLRKSLKRRLFIVEKTNHFTRVKTTRQAR